MTWTYLLLDLGSILMPVLFIADMRAMPSMFVGGMMPGITGVVTPRAAMSSRNRS